MSSVTKGIDLWTLRRLGRKVWRLDFIYRKLMLQLVRLQTKMNEYKNQNPINYQRYSEYSKVKQFIIRYFPAAVAGTDVILAFIVLRELTAHLSALPPLLTAFAAALLIVYLEISLGAMLDRTDEIPIKKPAAAQQKFRWEELKQYVASFFAFCVILIVPIISMSEFYNQIGVLQDQMHLGFMTSDGYQEAVRSLMLKYGSLAGLSLIVHGYLVFFCGKLFSAYGSVFYKLSLEGFDKQEEKLLKEKVEIEGKIVEALVRYDDKWLAHLRRFGTYVGMPRPRFSDYVQKVYKGVKTKVDNNNKEREQSTKREQERHTYEDVV